MAPPPAKRLAIHLTPAAVRAVRRGHPWVFDQGIRRQAADCPAGTLAVLFDRDRRFVGVGLYDPESPIRVRVLHHGTPETIDDAWFHTCMSRSTERRSALASDPGTTAYRLVHGENDGLPGLVVDRYSDTIVVKLDTVAWFPWLPLVLDLLEKILRPQRVVLRLSRTVTSSPSCPEGHSDGDVVRGSPLTAPVLFSENGIRFEADPVAGQKTGFFLDQRDNRVRVERLAGERDVLNVFSYTGGFSLYAARGGALSVTSLDLSAPALAVAERNFAHNGADPRIAAVPHTTICADAFEGLHELAASGRRFGLVVLDPPSFARKKGDVAGALAAYGRLAELGLAVLAPDGILVAASCSSRVPADAFFATSQQAAKEAGRSFYEIERTGHAMDHPIGFPEGAYLKCIFARCT